MQMTFYSPRPTAHEPGMCNRIHDCCRVLFIAIQITSPARLVNISYHTPATGDLNPRTKLLVRFAQRRVLEQKMCYGFFSCSRLLFFVFMSSIIHQLFVANVSSLCQTAKFSAEYRKRERFKLVPEICRGVDKTELTDLLHV